MCPGNTGCGPFMSLWRTRIEPYRINRKEPFLSMVRDEDGWGQGRDEKGTRGKGILCRGQFVRMVNQKDDPDKSAVYTATAIEIQIEEASEKERERKSYRKIERSENCTVSIRGHEECSVDGGCIYWCVRYGGGLILLKTHAPSRSSLQPCWPSFIARPSYLPSLALFLLVHASLLVSVDYSIGTMGQTGCMYYPSVH